MKKFHDYLVVVDSSANVSHSDYEESPSTAFLKYTVEAKDAIKFCLNQFPKLAHQQKYQKASRDSLQHLTTALLPAIMGHFETFQKYLFAGMFDNSVYLKDFDLDFFKKSLTKNDDLKINVNQLAAYRKTGATSVGVLLADNLFGWHDPKRVNKIFESFNLKKELFSKADCDELLTLWQFRHSIVHTGGTLTPADAQKIKPLAEFADKQINFEHVFTQEICRKFHQLIPKATHRVGEAFIKSLEKTISDDEKEKIKLLFQANSSISSWLPKLT